MNLLRERCAELVSTGSELLDGRRLNTHAQLLGSELSKLGLRLVRDTTVPDGPEAMRDAIESAVRRVDLVFVTGGLGPTTDDVTRDVIAGITGRPVVMHEPTRAANNEWLLRRRRKPNESFDRHALVVDRAQVLSNRAGLAPGERIEHDGKSIVLLPGPPHELQAIWEDHVAPWLRARLGGDPPLCRSFRFCSVGESDIAMRLADAEFSEAGLDVAYCARPGDVELRFTAPLSERSRFDAAVALVRHVFRSDIYSETAGEEIPLERITGELLRGRKTTLATAESCTGGLIGHRLTGVAGSSDYFRGGVIAYANEIKVVQLGVSAASLAQSGAVSEEVARQMAEGVRRALGAEIGLSTTGIAGPSGGSAEKPVGLVFMAVADARGTVAREYRTSGGRDYIKTVAAQAALDLLRRRVLGLV